VQENRPDNEEVFNALTHGVGAILALVGGVFLIGQSWEIGPWHFAGAFLYSVSLFSTFCASAFYHISTDPLIKHRYRVLDHSSIYLAIAGSYSPILLVSLMDNWGLLYCVVVWVLAIAGILYKSKYTGKHEEYSLGTYLMMGWIGLLIVHDIIETIPSAGLYWLLAGGIIYTSGAYFYYKDDKRWYHTIWHFFVLGGSMCHYILVSKYIIQP
tara:strand:- start:1115 stop:1750 length:636 start_codon:yes stop_codon:yes gene_type:complete